LYPEQFRVEGHFGLVFVIAAFWASPLAFRSDGFGFFRLLLRLNGRFFLGAADRLFQVDWVGAPLTLADQRSASIEKVTLVVTMAQIIMLPNKFPQLVYLGVDIGS
jgi:hypothetical protein